VAALGMGVGFGLPEMLANFTIGLIIRLERAIRVGDQDPHSRHNGRGLSSVHPFAAISGH
jgi:small-conductance mechanosensitive channel